MFYCIFLWNFWLEYNFTTIILFFEKLLVTEEATKIIIVQGVDGNKIAAQDINGRDLCLLANGKMEDDLFEVAGDTIKVWIKNSKIIKFEKQYVTFDERFSSGLRDLLTNSYSSHTLPIITI